MAWNGSDSGKAKARGEGEHRRKSPSAVRQSPSPSPMFNYKALVAGLIVVIGGGIAAWVMMRGERGESGETGERAGASQIAEVAPTIATNAPEVAVEKPKPIDPNARPTEVGEVVNGYVKLPSGRIHRRVGVITNSIAARPQPHYKIFKHRCDNEIACYLSLQPGDSLVGTRRYTGKFKQDFLNSMKEPIVVTSEDTPEQAKLKRDVIAARLELKDALDRGEDIEQIMIDTRNELQNLMRVKQMMRKVFNEAAKKCETVQDVDDALTACNQMLAEKGIAPLKCSPISKMNILHNASDGDGEAAANQKQPNTDKGDSK